MVASLTKPIVETGVEARIAGLASRRTQVAKLTLDNATPPE